MITSLWGTDDWASYLLMTHFAELYLGSHGELSPAQALIMAQRWLREEATYQTIVKAIHCSYQQAPMIRRDGN